MGHMNHEKIMFWHSSPFLSSTDLSPWDNRHLWQKEHATCHLLYPCLEVRLKQSGLRFQLYSLSWLLAWFSFKITELCGVQLFSMLTFGTMVYAQLQYHANTEGQASDWYGRIAVTREVVLETPVPRQRECRDGRRWKQTSYSKLWFVYMFRDHWRFFGVGVGN